MSLIQSALMRFYIDNPALFHDAKARYAALSVILDAVNRIRPYIDHVFVAIRKEADYTGSFEALNSLGDSGVHVYSDTPWYERQFSHVLNGILFRAGRDFGIEQTLIMSPECIVPESVLQALVAEYNQATSLAVGPVLPGHQFQPGKHEAHGSIIPWNQCSLVNIRMVMEAGGFSMAGDSPWDPDNAGVEEITTYASIQHARGGSARATVTLIQTPESVQVVQGHITANEPTRAIWNSTDNIFGKLNTKDSRPAAQMAKLPGLRPARVIHKIVR